MAMENGDLQDGEVSTDRRKGCQVGLSTDVGTTQHI
jgi:hypothetical protein